MGIAKVLIYVTMAIAAFLILMIAPKKAGFELEV